jgi:mRNA interferase RelE/StbE
MEVKYVILYHPKVVTDDIPSLTKIWKAHIRCAVENKLTSLPENYGQPLRQSLRGYRKLRIGDYRVVFRIGEGTVYILAILHRSVVYKNVQSRVT